MNAYALRDRLCDRVQFLNWIEVQGDLSLWDRSWGRIGRAWISPDTHSIHVVIEFDAPGEVDHEGYNFCQWIIDYTTIEDEEIQTVEDLIDFACNEIPDHTGYLEGDGPEDAYGSVKGSVSLREDL